MAVLELTNVSKHFGAIHAVNDVSFSIEPGEVVGLMGDNGAGKSTLVKMIAGNFRQTEGSMKMDGAELVLHKPVDARRHGIEIVHQDLALCNNLTAAANVFLGRELRRGVGPLKVLDYASMYRRAGEIFKDHAERFAAAPQLLQRKLATLPRRRQSRRGQALLFSAIAPSPPRLRPAGIYTNRRAGVNR